MKIIKVMVNAAAVLVTVLVANETVFSCGVGNPILAWGLVSFVGALVGALVTAAIERFEVGKTLIKMSKELKKEDNNAVNQ